MLVSSRKQFNSGTGKCVDKRTVTFIKESLKKSWPSWKVTISGDYLVKDTAEKIDINISRWESGSYFPVYSVKWEAAQTVVLRQWRERKAAVNLSYWCFDVYTRENCTVAKFINSKVKRHKKCWFKKMYSSYIWKI